MSPSGGWSKERRTPIRRDPWIAHVGCEVLFMVHAWAWADQSPPILGRLIPDDLKAMKDKLRDLGPPVFSEACGDERFVRGSV